MTPFKTCFFGAILLLTTNVLADSITEAANNMCNHLKVCIKGNIDADSDIPPSMRQMLDNMANTMCESIVDMSTAMAQKDLEGSAIACLNSVSKMSCAQLEGEIQTPECATYEKQIKEYYPAN